MTWLVEDPWTILGLGLLVEIVLAAALFHTRRGGLLVAMGGVLAAVLLALALEWLVVTEVEAVENTIHDAAAAVVAGDVEKVLAFVDSSAIDLRNDVKSHMARFDVQSVELSTMEISARGAKMRTATAQFIARVSGRGVSAADVALSKLPLNFEVELRHDGQRWRVTNYDLIGRAF